MIKYVITVNIKKNVVLTILIIEKFTPQQKKIKIVCKITLIRKILLFFLNMAIICKIILTQHFDIPMIIKYNNESVVIKTHRTL